jgi:hypothetical protein
VRVVASSLRCLAVTREPATISRSSDALAARAARAAAGLKLERLATRKLFRAGCGGHACLIAGAVDLKQPPALLRVVPVLLLPE